MKDGKFTTYTTSNGLLDDVVPNFGRRPKQPVAELPQKVSFTLVKKSSTSLPKA